MKTIITILIIIAVGAGIWYAVQTKPDANVPQAIVSDVNTNTTEEVKVENTTTEADFITGKTVDNTNVKIGFKGFGPGKEHIGSFAKIDSKLAVDGASIKGTVVADLNSISTDTEKVTAHLKTADFFDTAKYPNATFNLTSIIDGKAMGKLTVHGVTKDISFPVVASATEVKATFNIDMKEFGINQKFANEVIELTVTVPLK